MLHRFYFLRIFLPYIFSIDSIVVVEFIIMEYNAKEQKKCKVKQTIYSKK